MKNRFIWMFTFQRSRILTTHNHKFVSSGTENPHTLHTHSVIININFIIYLSAFYQSRYTYQLIQPNVYMFLLVMFRCGFVYLSAWSGFLAFHNNNNNNHYKLPVTIIIPPQCVTLLYVRIEFNVFSFLPLFVATTWCIVAVKYGHDDERTY